MRRLLLRLPEPILLSFIVDGVPNIRAAVRQNLRAGASQIKVMGGGGGSSPYDPIDTTQYSVAEWKAAVEAAADWGTYVTSHIFTDRARRCPGRRPRGGRQPAGGHLRRSAGTTNGSYAEPRWTRNVSTRFA